MRNAAFLAQLSLLLVLHFSSVTWAGPMEDAEAAYSKGEFAAELRITEPFAVKGEAWAQTRLALIYLEGSGLVQNSAEAVKWFRLAATQGFSPAQLFLGLMYYKGQGVVQDYVRSLMWLNLAAVSGNGDAMRNRDIAEKGMNPQQIAEVQKLVLHCQLQKFKGCD